MVVAMVVTCRDADINSGLSSLYRGTCSGLKKLVEKEKKRIYLWLETHPCLQPPICHPGVVWMFVVVVVGAAVVVVVSRLISGGGQGGSTCSSKEEVRKSNNFNLFVCG